MRVREGLELVRSSQGRRWLWRTARQRIHSRRIVICLRRDMNRVRLLRRATGEDSSGRAAASARR